MLLERLRTQSKCHDNTHAKSRPAQKGRSARATPSLTVTSVRHQLPPIPLNAAKQVQSLLAELRYTVPVTAFNRSLAGHSTSKE
jgi:hypothetical protein